ncbi:PsbP-related protein [Vagococcus sp. JNUCC 83]
MQKKRIGILVLALFFVLSACTSTKNDTTSESTDTKDDKLVYTLEYDHHQYQFNMLDGWRKFPNSDKSIAFLVGNKDSKSFMSAGFEEKGNKTLEDYKKEYLNKLNDSKAKVVLEPEKKNLNGWDAYYLGVEMKDAKNRTLTYRIYLIDTPDYFINLGAWTSNESPDEKTIQGLDDILSTFKEKE